MVKHDKDVNLLIKLRLFSYQLFYRNLVGKPHNARIDDYFSQIQCYNPSCPIP